MGTTYTAFNHTKKEYIEPPGNWGDKMPQIYMDNNPFCRMVCYFLEDGDWSGDTIVIAGDNSDPYDFFEKNETGEYIWKNVTEKAFKGLKEWHNGKLINILHSTEKKTEDFRTECLETCLPFLREKFPRDEQVSREMVNYVVQRSTRIRNSMTACGVFEVDLKR